MAIAEYLRSVSFNEIEEILWDAYGMGDNFTPFLKMTYDRVCHQTGISMHNHVIVQSIDGSLDSLGVNIIMPEGFPNDSLENIGKYNVIIRTKEKQADMSNIAAGILEAIIRHNLQRVLEPFHSFGIRHNTKVDNLICKTNFLIRRLSHNNCQGLSKKDFKWLYDKSYISENEYVSFAFDKNKRVDYIKELIKMFKLPISGWNGSLILTRTSSKHPLSADETNKLKEIILELGGNSDMWYRSYDESLDEELYLLIVKWFDKR